MSLFVAVALAALALCGVAGFLVIGALSGPVDWVTLVTDPVWDPARAHFGGAAMLWGTAAVSLLALVLAAPLGWALAIAINELAPKRLRGALRGGTELLAVVPSIVYGLVGIAYVRPFVASLTGKPGGDSLLAAALILAVMVLPTIVAVSLDALSRVPGGAREAAGALGLTRTEVIKSAVLPAARGGMAAAAVLGLARALGETVAVFLLIGRADGRLPEFVHSIFALGEPGQTITTKLNGPESILAGSSGAHWAALCALGLLLLVIVASLTAIGAAATRRRSSLPRRLLRRSIRGAARARRARDRVSRACLLGLLVLPPALFGLTVAAVLVRGSTALDPGFWLSATSGASGGGARDQILGTLVLIAAAAALAAPVGLGLGVVIAEAGARSVRRWLRVGTMTLAGVPSIVLGLAGYAVFVYGLQWGKTWVAGAILLAVIAIPVVAISVATALDALPAGRREAASALGLRRTQLLRSVTLPHARPALTTGLLLGLARAAGETAPLLFAATVFAGASGVPSHLTDAPVVALPTHIFTLAQDAADPAAIHAAWGAALALMIIAGALLLAAIPFRRRMEAQSA